MYHILKDRVIIFKARTVIADVHKGGRPSKIPLICCHHAVTVFIRSQYWSCDQIFRQAATFNSGVKSYLAGSSIKYTIDICSC